MQACRACRWNLVLSPGISPHNLMRGNESPFKLSFVSTALSPDITHHNHNQMPGTFHWSSWLSLTAFEYQTGLDNDSSSRGAKGEAPSHKELTPYWSSVRVSHSGNWGGMVGELPLCHRETLGSRAEQWQDENNALEQMSDNFCCTWPDCKILGFAGHMMAVGSNQCSIAAWKQP